MAVRKGVLMADCLERWMDSKLVHSTAATTGKSMADLLAGDLVVPSVGMRVALMAVSWVRLLVLMKA